MAKYTVNNKQTVENMDKDAMASQKDLDEIHTMSYILPLRLNWFLWVLYYLLVVCSLGLLLLLSRWFEWLKVRMTHTACSNEEADMVLIKVCFYLVGLSHMDRVFRELSQLAKLKHTTWVNLT